jgi:two-component system sensor histidine kinase KdpD
MMGFTVATIRASDVVRLLAGAAALIGVVFVCVYWLHETNTATISITFLLIVLVIAAYSHLWVAVVTSIVAMLVMNFFFMPPTRTLTISDPHNWVVLLVFLAASLLASNLSAAARARTQEAVTRRDELARLFDLSRDVLMMNESLEALSLLARSIARRFDLDYVAIALPDGDDWEMHEAGERTALDRRQLTNAFATARASLEFDASARTYAGHRSMTAGDRTIRLVPLRVRTTPIGILAAAGRPIEGGTLDTIGGIAAIAIERAELLEARKAGELTRQREELKTALLASISHDLRTPLTAIRIAASNIKSQALSGADREEQSTLILGEVERLSRLFENILDMARIDAGAIATEVRWVHPSEIVAAARDHVGHGLHHHRLDLTLESDVPVQLDPRLTSAALAHVLENAAQYSAPGSTIEILGRVSDAELRFNVRDAGPGIAPRDLAHLFDRFYRGDAATAARVSGTGMGLWIARGLLAAEDGRIWADNRAGGGAEFTIAVPAAVRAPVAESVEA